MTWKGVLKAIGRFFRIKKSVAVKPTGDSLQQSGGGSRPPAPPPGHILNNTVPVPLVCLGYLPLEIQARIKLRSSVIISGSDEQLKKLVAEQVRAGNYKNN